MNILSLQSHVAFGHVGRTIAWKGKGVDEKGIDAKSGQVLVEIDPRVASASPQVTAALQPAS